MTEDERDAFLNGYHECAHDVTVLIQTMRKKLDVSIESDWVAFKCLDALASNVLDLDILASKRK
jgi:hypothetical protein